MIGKTLLAAGILCVSLAVVADGTAAVPPGKRAQGWPGSVPAAAGVLETRAMVDLAKPGRVLLDGKPAGATDPAVADALAKALRTAAQEGSRKRLNGET